MIEEAEKTGRLKPGGTIVEPTSGNTGIGLAMVGAVKGYRVILTMPDDMSVERRHLLRAYGAELVLTPARNGMMGAVDRAELMVKENRDFFMPLQFENASNPEAHRRTTAREILDDLAGPPDAFVAGVGTGGTITGNGEVLRSVNPGIWITAVEPAGSPVLSGGDPGPHGITGIGAGFLSVTLNTRIYDEVVAVTDDEAAATARRLAVEEGVLGGISSGAAVSAALHVASKLGSGKRLVVILPDRGDRYLSTGLFIP
jgi:cysteine synthase A